MYAALIEVAMRWQESVMSWRETRMILDFLERVRSRGRRGPEHLKCSLKSKGLEEEGVLRMPHTLVAYVA